jgi:hypothetical protein
MAYRPDGARPPSREPPDRSIEDRAHRLRQREAAGGPDSWQPSTIFAQRQWPSPIRLFELIRRHSAHLRGQVRVAPTSWAEVAPLAVSAYSARGYSSNRGALDYAIHLKSPEVLQQRRWRSTVQRVLNARCAMQEGGARDGVSQLARSHSRKDGYDQWSPK